MTKKLKKLDNDTLEIETTNKKVMTRKGLELKKKIIEDNITFEEGRLLEVEDMLKALD